MPLVSVKHPGAVGGSASGSLMSHGPAMGGSLTIFADAGLGHASMYSTSGQIAPQTPADDAYPLPP